MFGPFDAKYSGIRIIFGCTGIEGEGEAQARPLVGIFAMRSHLVTRCHIIKQRIMRSHVIKPRYMQSHIIVIEAT